jgi:large subunit ribosomal protein L19
MEAIREIEAAHRKPALPQVKTGDTVRVHQLIKEGTKQRIQVFEGVIIRRHRMNELTACITVRRIASGVGVEKTFLMHSPNVSKIEILRRAKVRRNFLSYLRERRGKSARLQELSFDKLAANDVTVPEVAATSEDLDAEVTELALEENQDALDEAISINSEENSENAEAADEDDASSKDDSVVQDEQNLASEEVHEGLDKAEPGEGKAVKS